MSTSQPPADYTSLVDARSKDGIYVNVMGKVVDYMPPKQTSGSDWFCTFRLQDPSVAASFNVETSLGLRVRYFANESKHRLMPRINSLGDVVILRSVKCTTRSSEKMLISNPGTICAVIPKNNFPSEPYQDAFVAVTRPLDFLPTQPYGPLTPAEQLYAMHLHNNLDASISVFPASSRSLPSGPSGGAAPERPTMKFGLIEDLRISQFRDLVVEVVKIFPTNMWTDLYVTDYTSNELLQDRAAPDDISDSRAITSDPYGYIDSQGRKWQGPHGKLTLKIELRYPHDNYANSYVKPGDFVSLENVRVKQDGSGKLEGNMWQDRYKPERVQIEKLDGKHSRKMQHQQLHSLKLRKEQYLASLPKTTAPEDVEIKSKGVKKRERREKRKRAQEEREQERKRVEASFHDTDGLQAFAFVNKHGKYPQLSYLLGRLAS
ncbi:MAG: hypothetical protein M1820_001891 [Bogoriella megaspora]|nr:MAG: hypothetical protein M1820_001891 [Bogoriella megaspora]